MGGSAGIRSGDKQWCRLLGTIIGRRKEGACHVFATCINYGVYRELDEQYNLTAYCAIVKCAVKVTVVLMYLYQATADCHLFNNTKPAEMYRFCSSSSAINSVHKHSMHVYCTVCD
jgi:hypothetical protein